MFLVWTPPIEDWCPCNCSSNCSISLCFRLLNSWETSRWWWGDTERHLWSTSWTDTSPQLLLLEDSVSEPSPLWLTSWVSGVHQQVTSGRQNINHWFCLYVFITVVIQLFHSRSILVYFKYLRIFRCHWKWYRYSTGCHHHLPVLWDICQGAERTGRYEHVTVLNTYNRWSSVSEFCKAHPIYVAVWLIFWFMNTHTTSLLKFLIHSISASTTTL